MSVESRMKELGFITHDTLAFGDYDNSCAVERANVKVLKEKYSETFEVAWCSRVTIWNNKGEYEYTPDASTMLVCVEYGHGGCVAWLRDTEENQDIIAGLNEYPAIDDEAISEVENELEMEALTNWILHDLRKEIGKQYDESAIDFWDGLEESEVNALYYALKESANEYGHVESGGSFWIDVDKLAKCFCEVMATK